MSRYVVEGIQRDLANGLRVGLVGFTQVGAHEVFSRVAEVMAETAEKITRTNGRERITSREGGELHIFSRQSRAMRGVSLDVLVILDSRAYTYGQYTALMEEALPMLDASTDSEIIPA
ncbi:hypothetical protein [Paenarthrobacter sp. JL.01a]|uniref:hypothetical protein n=1 Tax=Paenarthrobacter sp. JL.01a TaxID=2979324 RepID=UPI0021C9F157|nr:hypothetical protein [Paenarthrobacter sp. JL.01a]UXM92563.1 hypothetical protein N5P29_04335 [Paenarthrobacter sp. JL.01a]